MEYQARIAAWKRMAFKILIVLDALANKRKTQAVLGEEAYKRIFQQARREENRRAEAHGAFHSRMINGELVGRPLTQGKGIPTVEPSACDHPTEEMVRRGTKGNHWWTCKLCKSRWQRTKPEVPQGNPTHDELLVIGIQAGRTFRWIWENEPHYAHWARTTVDMNPGEAHPQLHRLVAYLERREAQEADMDEEDELSEEEFNQL